MVNISVEEAREMLWEEFIHVPDKSIEQMVIYFDIIAKLLIEKIDKE